MKKVAFIALCLFALAILATNCILIYQNSRMQKDFADTVQVHFSKLQSVVGTLQHLSGTILSNLNRQTTGFDNRISNSEFVLVNHDGEQTLLKLNLSFSRVDEGENISLVLHEVGSSSFQRIELSKVSGAYYSAELILSPEKEYSYQISFEKDGVITSSNEYRIPAYYYNPYIWEVDPTLSIDTRKQVASIEFKLNSFSSKPYFKEFQISSAKIIVYKDGMILQELPYNISNYSDQYHVTFEIEGSSIEDYDFYLHLKYKGGFEKKQKISEPGNLRWEALVNQYLWFSKSH